MPNEQKTLSNVTLLDGQTYFFEDEVARALLTNENLLHNWYFVGGGSQQGGGQFPINQRGETSYPPASRHIDGWAMLNGYSTLEITQDSIRVSAVPSGSGATGNAFIRQHIRNLPLKAVITVSALIRGSGSGVLRVDTDSGTSTFFTAQSYNNPGSEWTLISGSGILSIKNNEGVDEFFTSGIFTFRVNASASIEIAAVKCELGTKQTLAHQENGVWVLNEIPDYQTELIRCKISTAEPADAYANKTIGYNVSNRNLLDNWYFVGGGSQLGDGVFPINRQELSTYLPTVGPTIDRWEIDTGVGVLVQTDSIKLTGSNHQFRQIIHNFPKYYNKPLTGSVLFKDGTLYSGTLTITDGTNGNISTSTKDFIFLTVSGQFRLRLRGNTTIMTFSLLTYTEGLEIQALKLELGTEQTLAHLENGVWVVNEIPDFTEELAKCGAYNFTGKVTYPEGESPGSWESFTVLNNVVFINLQTAARAHAVNDLLFTLPAKYAPSNVKCFTVIDVSTGGIASIRINTDGTGVIAVIQGSPTGRLLGSISYAIGT